MMKTNCYMRCLLLFGVLVSGLAITKFVQANDCLNEPCATMQSYFIALKNGDVELLKSLLTEPLLSNRKILLEQNTAYPAYLRNYYKGAGMMITNVNLTDDKNIQLVIVKISFKDDQNPLVIQFLLKNTDEGWKIAEEESMP